MPVGNLVVRSAVVGSLAAAALLGAPAAAGADTVTLTPTYTIGHGLNPGDISVCGGRIDAQASSDYPESYGPNYVLLKTYFVGPSGSAWSTEPALAQSRHRCLRNEAVGVERVGRSRRADSRVLRSGGGPGQHRDHHEHPEHSGSGRVHGDLSVGAAGSGEDVVQPGLPRVLRLLLVGTRGEQVVRRVDCPAERVPAVEPVQRIGGPDADEMRRQVVDDTVDGAETGDGDGHGCRRRSRYRSDRARRGVWPLRRDRWTYPGRRS